ncbi:MAG: hypothetical protein Q8865_01105 [Bacillota bacterium]|nr:hypothetical protein [Bacillota bacterium]
MTTLIGFELKKILKNHITYIALAIALLGTVITILLGIADESHMISDGLTERGTKAISLNKQYSSQFKGYLTDDRVKEIKDEYNSAPKSDKHRYAAVISAITNVQEGVIPDIKVKLKNKDISKLENSFFLMEPSKVGSLLNIKSEVINKLSSMYNNIKIPLYFDYFSGWLRLCYDFSIILVFICIMLIFCLSPIFSQEYSSGADSVILTTKYGKSKLIKAKIITAYIVSTSILFIFAVTLFIAYYFIYGFTGSKCNIQLSTIYLTSAFNLNFLGLWGLVFLYGFIGISVMTAITLLVSSKSNSPFYALSIALIIFFVPWIDISKISILIEKLFMLFPINLVDAKDNYKIAVFYNIFGKEIIMQHVMLITAVLCILILLPISYKSFKYHKN